MVLVLNKGYYEEGTLVVDRREILKNYLASWFFVNVAIVVCDWVSMALTFSDESRPIRLLRFAKLSSAFRLVGMLRIARLIRMYEESSLWAALGAIFCLVWLFGLLVFSLWMNHCLSCLFHFVGTLESTDTGLTWPHTTVTIGVQSVAYEDMGMVYLYSTAFRWPMSQITLGAIEVVSANTVEWVLSVVFDVRGFLLQQHLRLLSVSHPDRHPGARRETSEASPRRRTLPPPEQNHR